MNVKGTAIVARKAQYVKLFGDTRWSAFSDGFAKTCPEFQKPISTLTSISAKAFLDFNDALLREFHHGDTKVYWAAGEKSAEFALGETGPFKAFLTSIDLKEFAERAFPSLWKMYFSEGAVTVNSTPTSVEVTVRNVPIKHVYFEFTVMGYAKRALELYGAKRVRWTKLTGYEQGDPHYRFDCAA